MALLYTNLGLKKGSPLLPQHQAHVGSKPSPSHGPSRSTIGPKGPQRQARTPSPSGVPLVAMSWSPWCPVSLILPGGVLTWCLRVWQSSFFSNPSPPDVPPLLPPGVLSPLSSAITASPTRLRGCPANPRFRLEVCHPVRAGTFQSSAAARPPPACGAGTPPEPSREGRILCRESRLNLHLSVQRAFLTSSPLLPQDQAHVGSKLTPSHGPSRGTELDQKDLSFLRKDPGAR